VEGARENPALLGWITLFSSLQKHSQRMFGTNRTRPPRKEKQCYEEYQVPRISWVRRSVLRRSSTFIGSKLHRHPNQLRVHSILDEYRPGRFRDVDEQGSFGHS
jgi:hypothetical protein